MKFLVLEPHPNFGGGSEGVILSLAKGLSERGHELFLLCQSEGSMLSEYRAFVREVICGELIGFSRRSPWNTLQGIRLIGSVARNRRIDVILSSHLGFIVVCALVRLLYGVPVLFHLGLPSSRRSFIRRLSYPAIAAGVAPSRPAMVTWVSDGWPRNKIKVIPNWVDIRRFQPANDRDALREELGLAVNAPCIVFVGRLSADKGLEVLLEAFSRLLAAIPESVLVAIGPGEHEYIATLQARWMHRHPCRSRQFLVRPPTPNPELYLSAANIACLPFLREETFGLTVVEAMATAIPVIATRVGIIDQILGDPDLLVEPGQVEGLTEKLIQLLRDPATAQQKGRALRQRAIELFSMGPSIDEYEFQLEALVR